jgi:hypothetical protein
VFSADFGGRTRAWLSVLARDWTTCASAGSDNCTMYNSRALSLSINMLLAGIAWALCQRVVKLTWCVVVRAI